MDPRLIAEQEKYEQEAMERAKEKIEKLEKKEQSLKRTKRTFILVKRIKNRRDTPSKEERFGSLVEQLTTGRGIQLNQRQMMNKMLEYLKRRKAYLPRGIQLNRLKFKEMKELYDKHSGVEDLFGDREEEILRREMTVSKKRKGEAVVLVQRESALDKRLRMMNPSQRARYVEELEQIRLEESIPFMILGEYPRSYNRDLRSPITGWEKLYMKNGVVMNELTMADETTLRFRFLSEVLDVLDRVDLEELYQQVWEHYAEKEPKGEEVILFGELDFIFGLSAEDDEFYADQDSWELIRWKFYESCGICTLELSDGLTMYFLVDQRYKLNKNTLQRMLNLRLEVKEMNQVAAMVIRFVKRWIQELEEEADDASEEEH